MDLGVRRAHVLGAQVVLHHHSVNEPATVTKLVSSLNKSTGQFIKERPRSVLSSVLPVCLSFRGWPNCVGLAARPVRTPATTTGRFLGKNASGVVEIRFARPICIELFSGTGWPGGRRVLGCRTSRSIG